MKFHRCIHTGWPRKRILKRKSQWIIDTESKTWKKVFTFAFVFFQCGQKVNQNLNTRIHVYFKDSTTSHYNALIRIRNLSCMKRIWVPKYFDEVVLFVCWAKENMARRVADNVVCTCVKLRSTNFSLERKFSTNIVFRERGDH